MSSAKWKLLKEKALLARIIYELRKLRTSQKDFLVKAQIGLEG
jgi:hypothetical protein